MYFKIVYASYVDFILIWRSFIDILHCFSINDDVMQWPYIYDIILTEGVYPMVFQIVFPSCINVTSSGFLAVTGGNIATY